MKNIEIRVLVYELNECDDKFYNPTAAIVGRVRINQNLDFYQKNIYAETLEERKKVFLGYNTPGEHKGITKLKDGRFVIIRTFDNNHSQILDKSLKNYAYVVDNNTAIAEIISSNHAELLNNKKFKKLNEL